jgi:hypothetical protein
MLFLKGGSLSFVSFLYLVLFGVLRSRRACALNVKQQLTPLRARSAFPSLMRAVG